MVHEVRKGTGDEAAAMARALAAAFQEDPAMSWIFPDPARRPRLLERSFLLYLERIWLEDEETYTVAGNTGVAAWEPPGAWKLSVRAQLRLLPAMLRTTGRQLPRALGALARIERDHPTEPHYYLAFMGVEPAAQGRGLGSQLMFPVLSRCDADRVPAYLEASSPRNRALYERHGFLATEELRLGRGSPPVWRMWREPT